VEICRSPWKSLAKSEKGLAEQKEERERQRKEEKAKDPLKDAAIGE
jgi:hypothetical protein